MGPVEQALPPVGAGAGAVTVIVVTLVVVTGGGGGAPPGMATARMARENMK